MLEYLLANLTFPLPICYPTKAAEVMANPFPKVYIQYVKLLQITYAAVSSIERNVV
jgi:hypothetical protein